MPVTRHYREAAFIPASSGHRGYPGLIGRPVESLVPVELQAAQGDHRAAYTQAPRVRPMGAGARLVALRKDETTFPAEISLSPVAADFTRKTANTGVA